MHEVTSMHDADDRPLPTTRPLAGAALLLVLQGCESAPPIAQRGPGPLPPAPPGSAPGPRPDAGPPVPVWLSASSAPRYPGPEPGDVLLQDERGRWWLQRMTLRVPIPWHGPSPAAAGALTPSEAPDSPEELEAGAYRPEMLLRVGPSWRPHEPPRVRPAEARP